MNPADKKLQLEWRNGARDKECSPGLSISSRRLRLPGIVFIDNVSVLQNEKLGQDVMLWLCE